jgi:hypothetical protein
VTKVLEYVQFNASSLITNFRRKVAHAKDLNRQEANSFIADYIEGLEGYTYLESPLERDSDDEPAREPGPASEETSASGTGNGEAARSGNGGALPPPARASHALGRRDRR